MHSLYKVTFIGLASLTSLFLLAMQITALIQLVAATQVFDVYTFLLAYTIAGGVLVGSMTILGFVGWIMGMEVVFGEDQKQSDDFSYRFFVTGLWVVTMILLWVWWIIFQQGSGLHSDLAVAFATSPPKIIVSFIEFRDILFFFVFTIPFHISKYTLGVTRYWGIVHEYIDFVKNR